MENTNINIEMDDSQKAALSSTLFSSKGIVVITGGAGKGKTFVLTKLMEFYSKQGQNVEICCPTGKAAKVIINSFAKAGKSHLLENQPCTIHRLLKAKGLDSWEHDIGNPLKADVVIVDEASMIDSLLLARIIDGTQTDSKIILLGDANQLPPVGAGSPFKDICKKNDPEVVSVLTKNWRQNEGSLIADGCLKVLDGQKIIFGKKGEKTLGKKKEDDLFLKEVQDKEDICKTVVKLYLNRKTDNFQVLVPQNNTICGVKALNQAIQKAVNPPSKQKQEVKTTALDILREGDKVINKKNDYKKGVFNGFVGVIESIDKKNNEVIVNFEGVEEAVSFKINELKVLKLAYAITIHSSQGSEYSEGVIVIHSTHTFMLSNNLLYVALSRFKKRLTVVGDRKGIAHAIRNTKTNDRNTYLSDKI